jgi:large-conductance mechanosensitive channel
MNYQATQETVSYGNSTNPNTSSSSQLQQQQPQDQQQPGQQPQKKHKFVLLDNIKTLLNAKTGIVLTYSIGIAIGASFKDLIASFISNIIQPLFIKLLILSNVNSIYNLEQYVSLEKNAFNFATFISALVSFLFLCILLYYVNLVFNDL